VAGESLGEKCRQRLMGVICCYLFDSDQVLPGGGSFPQLFFHVTCGIYALHQDL
jgi:hypothetical protein